VLTAALMGCQQPSTALPSATPSLATSTTASARAIATPTIAPTATPKTDVSQPFTITLWVPPDMAATGAEGENDSLLTQARQRVMASYPNAHVEILPKASDGPGSIPTLLPAMQPVLPTHLPDAALVDAADIRALVEKGLVAPLDGLISENLWDDLYPYAQRAVTVNGVRYGVPLDTTLTAMFYNAAMVAEPPTDWDGLLATSGGYLFPTGSGDGTAFRLFLTHYSALGGVLRGEDGRPMLDAPVAARVLRGYRELAQAGVIAEEGLSLDSADACWSVYLTGEAALCSATSYQYLRDRDRIRRTRYAPQASFEGPAPALATSRAWVIVTPDATRQEVAALFISHCLLPAPAATWLSESHRLPTMRSPLPLLIDDEEERAFWDSQLEGALPAPDADLQARVRPIVEQALQDVLEGAATPEQAAVTAALAVESTP